MKPTAPGSYVKKLANVLFVMVLAACSTEVGNTVKISDQKMAKYEAMTSMQAAAELEKRIMLARRDGMPLLSPGNFDKAFEILVSAKFSLSQMPQNRVVDDVVRADAFLDQGEIRMGVVKSRLTNELALKAEMDKDRVAKIYPEEYQKIVEDLSSLIEKVERGESGDLEADRRALAKRMELLDVRAIQYNALHQSDVMNEATRNADGEKLATATLAEAYRVYKDAERRIEESPQDIVSVQKASADAMFAARHARFILQRVAALQVKIRESAELVALDEERVLSKIANALGLKDLRDQPIEKQANDISAAVTEMVQGRKQSDTNAANVLGKSLETRLREVNEVLAQNNELLAEKDVKLSEKETLLFEKIALLSEKDTVISEKNAQIKSLGDQILQLQEKNAKLLSAISSGKNGKQK
jgi:hypothetical protein